MHSTIEHGTWIHWIMDSDKQSTSLIFPLIGNLVLCVMEKSVYEYIGILSSGKINEIKMSFLRHLANIFNWKRSVWKLEQVLVHNTLNDSKYMGQQPCINWLTRAWKRIENCVQNTCRIFYLSPHHAHMSLRWDRRRKKSFVCVSHTIFSPFPCLFQSVG